MEVEVEARGGFLIYLFFFLLCFDSTHINTISLQSVHIRLELPIPLHVSFLYWVKFVFKTFRLYVLIFPHYILFFPPSKLSHSLHFNPHLIVSTCI